MQRWLVLALLLTSLGCKQSTASFDPFSTYGPTLIPPPPTGTAGRNDPYYQRSAAPDTNNPNALSVFTSDQNNAVQVADQRGNAVGQGAANAGVGNSSNGNQGGLQWQTPVTDDPVLPSGSSPQVRPSVPNDRRIGRAAAPIGSSVGATTQTASTTPQVSGAARLLQPNPPVATYSTQAAPPVTPPAPTYTPPSYNAPASYQQPAASQSSWQSRY